VAGKKGLTKTDNNAHYGSQWLPRVPVALGEAFPECNTRGRGSGEATHGEQAFPECHISHTRERGVHGVCNAHVLAPNKSPNKSRVFSKLSS
jgi:hypothetical protein